MAVFVHRFACCRSTECVPTLPNIGTIPTNGLVVHYPLENDSLDISSNNYHGTDNDMSYDGVGATFDGVMGRINLPTSLTSRLLNSERTGHISAWVYHDPDHEGSSSFLVGGGRYWISKKNRIQLSISPDGHPSLGAGQLNSPELIRINGTTSLACGYNLLSVNYNLDTHTVSFFANGVFIGEETDSKFSPSGALSFFGSILNSYSYSMYGVVSNFLNYNRHLTVEEIQNLVGA